MKPITGMLLAASLALSFSAQALTLDYKGFYDRLDKLYQPGINRLKLVFYFKDRETGAPCRVNAGRILRHETAQPLLVGQQQQLLLPFDRDLRQNAAVIQVALENEPRCDFAMQIQAETLDQTRFSGDQLAEIRDQMNRLMRSYAGVGFGWLQPEVKGVTLSLVEGTKVSLEGEGSVPQSVDGKLMLTPEQLVGATLILSRPPRTLSPLM
ncbi:DUF2987 domain-containing protein [Ferrimonas sediminicola]|uniref:DUF2987 domain-containing protein n=1 Tax=Ferrimonas sediminicola TaxID=2569538 RepID=A0A4U1BJ04_9GAMM|nr:DUF2987 domain-containing protein [Ferrimonas sediminicola]TKB50509.1 DUF2987 domain-containing protein [Ferrimonas sediminicola]